MNKNTLLQRDAMELIKKTQQGCETSKAILVKSNIPLIKSIVKKFVNRGYEYDDLFQIGSIGLIKAIKNFDIKYNVMFSTYAVPMIMGEIKRFIRDNSVIKVSRSVKDTALKARMMRDKLRNEYNRDPTIQEIADNIEREKEEVVYALEAVRAPRSIYETVFQDDGSPILLIDQMTHGITAELELIDKITLKEALSNLKLRERQIIIMRYFKDKTQTQIAAQLGISQVQVSRIEKKIIEKMRNKM